MSTPPSSELWLLTDVVSRLDGVGWGFEQNSAQMTNAANTAEDEQGRIGPSGFAETLVALHPERNKLPTPTLPVSPRFRSLEVNPSHMTDTSSSPSWICFHSTRVLFSYLENRWLVACICDRPIDGSHCSSPTPPPSTSLSRILSGSVHTYGHSTSLQPTEKLNSNQTFLSHPLPRVRTPSARPSGTRLQGLRQLWDKRRPVHNAIEAVVFPCS
ncbi:unnamed protein product [Cyclocybe aegerita]|uniref:Uncharacterized protein n=1 Tax=Cyclocybe aegerita TaxID=1973307 RepID=A0A8S0X7X8_CYCAE|nr:unnamed protein product [Cyclocybe aegerita]